MKPVENSKIAKNTVGKLEGNLHRWWILDYVNYDYGEGQISSHFVSGCFAIRKHEIKYFIRS